MLLTQTYANREREPRDTIAESPTIKSRVLHSIWLLHVWQAGITPATAGKSRRNCIVSLLKLNPKCMAEFKRVYKYTQTAAPKHSRTTNACLLPGITDYGIVSSRQYILVRYATLYSPCVHVTHAHTYVHTHIKYTHAQMNVSSGIVTAAIPQRDYIICV